MTKKEQRAGSAKDESSKPFTILVAEDNEDMSRLIEMCLKEAGYRVDVTNSGTMAIDTITHKPPELILTNYKLPDMHARQIVENLRECQSEIPFVIMAEHGAESVVVEMMKAGARDYIMKGVNFMDLLPLVVKRVLKQVVDEKKLVEAENHLRKLSHAIKRSPAIVEKNNSKPYWEHSPISPVKNSDDVVTDFIATKEDITEHKKIEKSLMQSEKLKSIGIMTLGIAHEFNNILAIISGNIYLLEERYKGDKELMDALHTIKTATDDGVGITNRMFKFTRTEKNTTEYAAHDLTNLIKQATDFTMPRWRNMAQANNINYQMDMEGAKGALSILCNPTEIREVFINIINNALDAMPDGGRISFNTCRNEDLVQVNVSDTGKGMAEDVKNNIFDLFFTTRRPEGTGLGMSTSFSIIKMHGGSIEVSSEEGKGSTFTLQFPTTRKTVSPEISSEPVEEQEIKCNEIRVLVVDDDEAICKLLDKFLSGIGLKVETVVNGAKAIEMAKKEKFDIVLCDMAMPHVCGYDVIKALNKLDERPKIGIITGWGEKLKPTDADDLKVDFIAKKPFNFKELSILINRAFSSY